MTKLLKFLFLLAAAGFLFVEGVLRLVSKKHPFPCPWQVAWVLDNPIRRRFFGPRKTLNWVGVAPGMKVLEVGPGSGYLTLEAARRLGSGGQLCSLDIQPKMIASVSRKLRQHRVENVALLIGDATALPFADESFDLVFFVTVLGEIPNKDKALREVHRVLQRGGIVSVTEILPDPDYSFKRTTIARCRRAGFETWQEHGNLFAYTVNLLRR